MNTTEEEMEFDYQAYMKDYTPDPDKIHWGLEARQKRREAAIHNNRGLAYAQKGDYDRAIEAFTEAIELNPNYAYAYNNRGGAYYAKHDYDRAIVDYTIAIDCLSNYINPYTNRGLAYCDKGNFDLAIADYTKVINLKPDAEAYNNRGTAYRKKGDYDLAIVDYTKAKELNLDNKNIYSDYRIWLAAIIESCDEAIKINSNDAALYYNRGLAWLHLQAWAKAKTDLMIAKNMGADIIASFHNTYENVADFDRRNKVKLPTDLAKMLTL